MFGVDIYFVDFFKDGMANMCNYWNIKLAFLICSRNLSLPLSLSFSLPFCFIYRLETGVTNMLSTPEAPNGCIMVKLTGKCCFNFHVN